VLDALYGHVLFYHMLTFVDGFFDAGMLLQALKANSAEKEKASEKAIVQAKRSVGKRLTLQEF